MTQRPLLGAQHVYLDAARPKQMVAICLQNTEEQLYKCEAKNWVIFTFRARLSSVA